MDGDRIDGGATGGTGGPPPPPPPPGGAPPPPPPPPGRGAASRPGPGDGRGPGWGRRIIPLHPLTVGDLLDGAFKLWRGTATQVSLAVLVVFGSLQFITALALRDVGRGIDLDPAATTITLADVIPPATIIAIALTSLVTMLVTPLVNGAVTWIAARHDLGEDRRWDEGYQAAWTRFGSLLGAAVLTLLLGMALTVVLGVVIGLPTVALFQVAGPLAVLVAVVGVLALAVPAYLALAAIFYVVVPAIMVEGATAAEALQRSYRLIRPRLFRNIGVVVLAGLLIGLVSGVVGGAFGLLSFVAGPAGWVLEAIGNTLAQVVTVPIAANIALLLYVDARVRGEGFDIEMMAQGLPRA